MFAPTKIASDLRIRSTPNEKSLDHRALALPSRLTDTRGTGKHAASNTASNEVAAAPHHSASVRPDPLDLGGFQVRTGAAFHVSEEKGRKASISRLRPRLSRTQLGLYFSVAFGLRTGLETRKSRSQGCTGKDANYVATRRRAA